MEIWDPTNKKKKLKRQNVIEVVNYLYNSKQTSEDIYIDDLMDFFKTDSKVYLKSYIKSNVPELQVSASDVVYQMNDFRSSEPD